VAFAVDPGARYAYALEHGLEPSELGQFSLSYDPRRAEPLTVQLRHTFRGGVFGHTLCVAADGSRVYAANSTADTPVFSADTLLQIQALPGGGDNAACGWNGLFFGGAGGNVSVYRLDGTAAGTFAIPADPGTLVLSGDNTRIAGSIRPFQGTPALSIRTTPAP
jgi:hypothetical protein